MYLMICLVDLYFHRLADKYHVAEEALLKALRHGLAQGVFYQRTLKFLLHLLRLFLGKKRRGFYHDEPRRHLEELRSDLKIRLGHSVKIQHELIQQNADLDILDIQLVLLNERQHEVQRTLEYLKLEVQSFHQMNRFIRPPSGTKNEALLSSQIIPLEAAPRGTSRAPNISSAKNTQ